MVLRKEPRIFYQEGVSENSDLRLQSRFALRHTSQSHLEICMGWGVQVLTFMDGMDGEIGRLPGAFFTSVFQDSPHH